jgi:sarcosine oxidase subunit beta
MPGQPDRLWRSADPKPAYDVIIVGAGGHGLATAYYLAARHGITDVCVVEKGWLGGGNVARNTTVIRSNYLWDASAAIYEHSLKLWEGLEEELDWDLQFDQKGVLNILHHLGEVRGANRRVEANHLQGVDAEMLDAQQVKEFCPIINISPDVRYPVIGGALQRRGGTARHDRVAWSYATRASEAGVDIVEHCEVTGFLRGPAGEVTGVETTRGPIRAAKVGLVAAGHTSVLAGMVGLRLPLQSHPLQALVSALYEPVMPCVIMSAAVHVYVSQADKGELVIGAGIDQYNGYGQRGSFHVIEHQMAAAVELFPIFRHASLLRTWGGIVDVNPDASPIIDRTPIDGLYLNCGWGTGGFKATPGSGWVFADTLANGEPHELAKPYSLDRFVTGALIDEHGAAGVAH